MYTVSKQTFSGLKELWHDRGCRLSWTSVFVLPCWLEEWWRTFGAGEDALLLDIREAGELTGIAAMRVKDSCARFMGSDDVCDYMDFAVVLGRENAFCSGLLDYLGDNGIRELKLDSLRPDSIALASLAGVARERGFEVSSTLENVSLDLELPESWEGYLTMLTSKQRREVNRKLRRLYEEGGIEYLSIEDAEDIHRSMDIFLRLHRGSREDKAAFMSDRMESFFRAVARSLSQDGMARLGILKIDGRPVAAVLCFDYNGTVYLYNSGFDTGYSHVSAGLLSKVISIRDSIQRGRRVYDFLKGAEEYKYRLGGREIPVYSCCIMLG